MSIMRAKKKILVIFLLINQLISQYSEGKISNVVQQLRPLKILFVTSKFPHATRVYTDNQIAGLLDKGHDVYILARQPGKYADYPLIKQYNLLARTYYFEQIEGNKKVPAELKDIDIIYCQFAGLGEYCLQLKKTKKIDAPLIICLRGADATKAFQRNPHCYDNLFVKANLFLPVCEYFKNNMIKYGCDPNKIIIHHSAIDCAKFEYKKRKNPKRKAVKFIVVATLSERKGIRYILYALNKLKKKYPQIKLTILGSDQGEREKQKIIILNIINELNLHKYVTLLGFQLHQRVVSALHDAHIFVLTSYTRTTGIKEGIPNSLMEAMATGMPVIATQHGGIPELVKNGKSGFLVPEQNVDELVKKMAYLIDNPSCWEQMGRFGAAWVRQEHDKDKAVDKLINIFLSVLNKNNNQLFI
ncbi:MAG: glycosyltransferase [Candidatus Babeliales bacterium]